jgi:hypothetical protein
MSDAYSDLPSAQLLVVANSITPRPAAALRTATVRWPAIARDAADEILTDAEGEAALDASTEQA